MSPVPVDVKDLMREIEDDVRAHAAQASARARRRCGLSRSGCRMRGSTSVLRRAIEARDPEALLLPDFLSSEADWDLSLHLKYASHRPATGGADLLDQAPRAAAADAVALRILARELPAAAAHEHRAVCVHRGTGDRECPTSAGAPG